MALTPRRHLFGRASGDWATRIDENDFFKVAGTATLWLFDAASGGSRITDLQNASFQSITEVVTSSTGAIPNFYGPEDVARLWAGDPSGEGERTLLVAVDLDLDVDDLDSAIDNISVEAGIQSINGTLLPDGEGNLDIAASDLNAADASDVTNLLATAFAVVHQSGSGYPPRPSYADTVLFKGSVDPGAAAVNGKDLWARPAT